LRLKSENNAEFIPFHFQEWIFVGLLQDPLNLMFCQIEGRYPEHHPKIPTPERAKEVYFQTKDLLIWIK